VLSIRRYAPNYFELCLLFCLCLAGPVHALKIITCECPPLSYIQDGKLMGPAVEIVKRIQNHLNTQEEILIYPWARAYAMMQEEADVMLFSTTRTKHRDNSFAWVGPIATKTYSLYGLASKKYQVNNIEGAKKYRVGVLRDSTNHQHLIKRGFEDINVVSSSEQNLKMLQFSRIDLWYTDAAIASELSEQLNLDFFLTEVHRVHVSESFFAFNISTSRDVIKKWQGALDALYQKGVILEIYKKFKLEYLYPVRD